MVKNPPANAGDTGSVTGSERSPGRGNDNPLQYYCLEHLMVRGAWWATVHGVTKIWTRLTSQAQHNEHMLPMVCFVPVTHYFVTVSSVSS